MTEGTVYRSGRLIGILLLLGGILFLAFGVCGLIAVGLESWYFFGVFASLGALCVVGGVQSPFQRLLVDRDGLTRVFWFGMLRPHTTWEAIQSWVAVPKDVHPKMVSSIWSRLYPERITLFPPASLSGEDAITPVALFRVRGYRWPLCINNWENWQPSFESFLTDVRGWIQNKEIIIPGLQGASPQE